MRRRTCSISCKVANGDMIYGQSSLYSSINRSRSGRSKKRPRCTTPRARSVIVMYSRGLASTRTASISKWLHSPVIHHTHHSYLEKHWDTNLAALTSIWNRLFGKLYIPEKDEYTPWGLGPEMQDQYRSCCRIRPAPSKTGSPCSRVALCRKAIPCLGVPPVGM